MTTSPPRPTGELPATCMEFNTPTILAPAINVCRCATYEKQDLNHHEMIISEIHATSEGQKALDSLKELYNEKTKSSSDEFHSVYCMARTLEMLSEEKSHPFLKLISQVEDSLGLT